MKSKGRALLLLNLEEHIWLPLFPLKACKTWKQRLGLIRTKRKKEQQLRNVSPMRNEPVHAPEPRESSGLEASRLAFMARVRYRTEIILSREQLGPRPCSIQPGSHTSPHSPCGENEPWRKWTWEAPELGPQAQEKVGKRCYTEERRIKHKSIPQMMEMPSSLVLHHHL